MTLRQVTDLGSLVGVDAHGEELRQEGPGRVEHPECPVLGIGQLGRRFDDALERRGEIEVGADRDDGAEKPSEAPRAGDPSIGHEQRLGLQQ